jgi:hypothetical protein
LQGGGYGLIEVQSRHLPGATEEINENQQSGWPVSQMIFETGTSQIRVYSFTAMPAVAIVVIAVAEAVIRGPSIYQSWLHFATEHETKFHIPPPETK